MTKLPLTYARNSAAARTTTPPAMAMTLPTKSLVTVDLVMACLPVADGTRHGSISSDTREGVGDRAVWRAMEAEWPYGWVARRAMLLVVHQAKHPPPQQGVP